MQPQSGNGKFSLNDFHFNVCLTFFNLFPKLITSGITEVELARPRLLHVCTTINMSLKGKPCNNLDAKVKFKSSSGQTGNKNTNYGLNMNYCYKICTFI